MQSNNLEVVVIYPESETSNKQNSEPKATVAQPELINLVESEKEPVRPIQIPVESTPIAKEQNLKEKEPIQQKPANPYLPEGVIPIEQFHPVQTKLDKEDIKTNMQKGGNLQKVGQEEQGDARREEDKSIERQLRMPGQQTIEPIFQKQSKKVNLVFDVATVQQQQAPEIIQEGPKMETQVPIRQNKEESSEPVPQLPVERQEVSQKGNRVIGIIILFIMGGVFWIYGWASEYHAVTNDSFPVNSTTQSLYVGLLILTTIFTVIGFGLLLMYFKKTSESALFSSLFIVSFTMIISPIFHKYWYNIFITDFSGTFIKTNDTRYLFNQSMGGTNILLNLYNIKYSLITSISQLVVLLGLLNKLSAIQLVTFSFFYNFAWSLNHYLLVNIQNKSPDVRLFDDYSIASVYIFGAAFGFIAMLLVKKPNSDDNQIESSDHSAIFAHVGAFFLFLAFCATTILYPQKTPSRTLERNIVSSEAFINCFFALSASVLFSYTFSIIYNQKITVRDSVFGVIGGGILFGCVAGLVMNIGAAIACGLAAGFFSATFYRFIYPQINRKRIIDNYGISLTLFISIVATIVIPPIVIRIYQKHSVILATLQRNSTSSGDVIASQQAAGFALTYPSISIGIGCGTALIISLLFRLLDKFEADKILTDKLYFLTSHGLRPTKQLEKPQKVKPSQLKKRSSNAQKKSNDKNLSKTNLSKEMLNSQQALEITIHKNKVSNISQEIRKDISSREQ